MTVSKYSVIPVCLEGISKGKVTTPALDFSVSLTCRAWFMPRLKSSYLAFSRHGGCNLHSVNFMFVTLNFICHFIAQSSLLCNAIPYPSISTVIPYFPPGATYYQQTMLLAFFPRTSMKILKDPDMSMNPFGGLLVTSLL